MLKIASNGLDVCVFSIQDILQGDICLSFFTSRAVLHTVGISDADHHSAWSVDRISLVILPKAASTWALSYDWRVADNLLSEFRHLESIDILCPSQREEERFTQLVCGVRLQMPVVGKKIRSGVSLRFEAAGEYV